MTKNMKSVPLLGGLAHRGYRTARKSASLMLDWVATRQLAAIKHPDGARFLRVLGQLRAFNLHEENSIALKIEVARRRMLLDAAPLNDHTLEGEGKHDEKLAVYDAARVSKRPTAALLLYYLIREFQPRQALELGTNVGVSAAYQAAALMTYQPHGNLATMELSPYRIRLAKGLHKELGLDNIEYVEGWFTDTLQPTLDRLGTADFAFIDGHHLYQSTLDYFEIISRHLSDEAIVVFDDIRWTSEMKKAWDEIQDNPRVSLALDLGTLGVCVVAPPSSSTRPHNKTVHIRGALRVDHRNCSPNEARYLAAMQQIPK